MLNFSVVYQVRFLYALISLESQQIPVCRGDLPSKLIQAEDQSVQRFMGLFHPQNERQANKRTMLSPGSSGCSVPSNPMKPCTLMLLTHVKIKLLELSDVFHSMVANRSVIIGFLFPASVDCDFLPSCGRSWNYNTT